MKNLNNAQMEQITELGNVTDKDFASLMLKHTHFLTSEQLEKCYDETSEIDVDFMHVSYDVNYYNVASEYAVMNPDRLELAFNGYGELTLYMDELGQGLIVGCY